MKAAVGEATAGPPPAVGGVGVARERSGRGVPAAPPVVSTSPIARQDRAGRLPALLFALVVAVVYGNGLRMGFHFDDEHVIERNPAIRSLANVPRFFVDPATSSSSHQNRHLRPVLLATFALNWAISGDAPWSYHLLNLLLHWLTVLLVFRIVRDHLWLGEAATAVAVAAALIVAAHPLNTSAVNYVSARSALMVAVFYLGAFDTAVRGRRVASAVLFVLALATKEIAVTLPLMLLGYSLVARARTGALRAPLPWWFVTLLGTLALASLAYRAILVPPEMNATRAPDMTSDIYFMTGWSAYLYYLRLFLWPDALVIDRLDYAITRSFWEPRAWGSLLVLLAFAGVAWHARRRRPALTVAVLWFFVALAAESTIFPLAEAVNEHRPYLAMLGIATAAALGLWQLGVAVSRRAQAPAVWVFAILATFVTTGLGAAAIGRNQTWRDDYTLWRDATEKAPENPRAWLNAGHAALNRGDLPEARRLLLEAHRLAPGYAYVQANLSVVARLQGDAAESLRWTEDGVRCGPGLALAHYYHGIALERVGRPEDAVAAYARTTDLDAHYADAWFAQARLREAKSEWAEAAAAYERVVTVDPGRAEAGMSAAVLYHHRLGDPGRAVGLYRTALRAVPTHYGAHYQLAVALLALGQEAEARAAWRAFVPLARSIGDQQSLAAAPAVLREVEAAASP